MTQFNNRIRQVVLLLVIAFLAFLIARELYVFLPGLMGALTFYILGRERYFRLTEKRGWKPGLTAMLIIVVFLLLIAAPLYYTVLLISPKVGSMLSHTDELLVGLQALSDKVKSITGGRNIFGKKHLIISIEPGELYPHLSEQFCHDSQQHDGHVFCHVLYVHRRQDHGGFHPKVHPASPGKCSCLGP